MDSVPRSLPSVTVSKSMIPQNLPEVPDISIFVSADDLMSSRTTMNPASDESVPRLPLVTKKNSTASSKKSRTAPVGTYPPVKISKSRKVKAPQGVLVESPVVYSMLKQQDAQLRMLQSQLQQILVEKQQQQKQQHGQKKKGILKKEKYVEKQVCTAATNTSKRWPLTDISQKDLLPHCFEEDDKQSCSCASCACKDCLNKGVGTDIDEMPLGVSATGFPLLAPNKPDVESQSLLHAYQFPQIGVSVTVSTEKGSHYKQPQLDASGTGKNENVSYNQQPLLGANVNANANIRFNQRPQLGANGTEVFQWSSIRGSLSESLEQPRGSPSVTPSTAASVSAPASSMELGVSATDYCSDGDYYTDLLQNIQEMLDTQLTMDDKENSQNTQKTAEKSTCNDLTCFGDDSTTVARHLDYVSLMIHDESSVNMDNVTLLANKYLSSSQLEMCREIGHKSLCESRLEPLVEETSCGALSSCSDDVTQAETTSLDKSVVTRYGMREMDLTASTRDYLRRHNLLEKSECTLEETVESPAGQGSGSSDSSDVMSFSSNSSCAALLDIRRLKNMPKLL